MKVCNKCKIEKSVSEFQPLKRGGYSHLCKLCLNEYNRNWRLSNWFRSLWMLKKSESRKNNLDFDLTPEYLESIWTDYCPIFGLKFVPLKFKEKKLNANPELDRIIPEKGYIQGNVVFISARANRIKYDASVEELEAILNWYKRILNDNK